MTGLGTYIAFALPLGTDSGAVATAYGAAGSTVTWRRRLVVCGTLTAFEALMPGVGMLAAGPVSHVIGNTAHYFAALLLVGIGLVMLLGDDDGPTLDGRALAGVALAVSIDEMAVGVGLGLHGASFPALAACIAVWVGAATLTGMTLGSRVPPRFHGVAEVVAAVLLIGLGVLIGLGLI